MADWLTRHDDRVTLALRVQPRASRDEVAGLHGDRLKLRITAPPVDGAANEHLCRFLARLFGIPPSRVTLLKGTTGRDKLVALEGVRELPEAIVRLLPGVAESEGHR
ncbi:MAG: DUF167 family protein [Steroidobacteraceae bacterium]|nr:DUF167 family protein [Steroidobacteraceae bacterium]